MKHIYQLHKLILLPLLVILIVACNSNNEHLIKKDKNSDLTFYLKVPQELLQTRSMTEEDTYKIDFSTMKLLLFKEGKFLKQAMIDNLNPEFNEEEDAYEIRISDIERDNSQVDFVFIANNEFAVPNTDEIKTNYYKRLTFTTKGKWDTETPRLLPLWGEIVDITLDENVGTIYSPNKLKVSLLRSVARIDIIASMPHSNNNEANSLQFYLSEIYLIKSLDSGCIAPHSSNYDNKNTKVTAPTQLESAKYNVGSGQTTNNLIEATNNPIVYKLDEPTKEFKSELFVPEQKATNKDSFLTLVVGGTTNHTNTVTYYRIDFHRQVNNQYELFDLLRNHKYLIDIKGVRGAGYDSVQNALINGSTNIEVDFVIWDEAINEGYIFGDKYFGINSSDIYFEKHTAGQIDKIHMQSNLTLEELKNSIQFNWEKGGLFDAEFIETDNLDIQITTRTENKSNQELEDILNITAFEHSFQVKVTQNTEKPDYRLICEETKVRGVYQKDIALKESNYIEVITRSEQDISGQRYEISTDKIDGIEFYGEGNFNMVKKGNYYYQKIKLQGEGKALTTIPKIITIIPNSKNFHACTTEIKMAYTAKNIVGLAVNDTFGYCTQNGYSKKLRESEYAFGLKQESVIKVPKLMNLNYLGLNPSNNILKEALTNADILILGYSSTITTSRAKVIVDYLEKGGVVIILSEVSWSIQNFFNTLYQGTTINVTSVAAGAAGTRYPFITQPGDPISDGPFGSVHGKCWGEDASVTFTVQGVPDEDIVIYSGSVPYGREERDRDKGVCIFRHTDHNLFFIGDAGFISQSGTNAALNSLTICPFLVNDKGLPIKKRYGAGSSTVIGDVYNSIFFANVLAWALERAEFHGINSGL